MGRCLKLYRYRQEKILFGVFAHEYVILDTVLANTIGPSLKVLSYKWLRAPQAPWSPWFLDGKFNQRG